MIREPIQQLRKQMEIAGLDAYLITGDDFHGSEYVGAYFKCREYISGFTGSAGTLLVTRTTAGLWTDGRYFLQAESQLAGSGITLFRVGLDGTPTLIEYLNSQLEAGQCLGFDGRTVNDAYVRELERALHDKQIKISWEQDLVGAIWAARPLPSHEPVMALGLQYAGRTRAAKLQQIRTVLQEKAVDYLILTTLDDIAWLFNIRGNDVRYNPVVLAYAVISRDSAFLFAANNSFSETLKTMLRQDGVRLKEYDQLYPFLKQLPEDGIVMLDRRRTSRTVVMSLPEQIRICEAVSPCQLPKAIKNQTEIANVRIAHIRDGVAVTKFICWLKQYDGTAILTERSAAAQLEQLRRAQEHYRGASFEPIFAYNSHSAIIHYTATAESDFVLEKPGLLLMDTGGHYLEGSTDITRTISLGAISQRQKEHYTAVLKGNLNLSAAKFCYGCRGINLDYLARQPLWELGLDYQHGTGHGVGYLLNVHEGPNNIRWQMSPVPEGNAVFEAGMITSNEPGVYLPGEYGIRLENLMLCQNSQKNEYGQFMQFETLTMVPFDRDCIVPELLSEREKALLNEYHRIVTATLSPFLNQAEKAWLEEAAREL